MCPSVQDTAFRSSKCVLLLRLQVQPLQCIDYDERDAKGLRTSEGREAGAIALTLTEGRKEGRGS